MPRGFPGSSRVLWVALLAAPLAAQSAVPLRFVPQAELVEPGIVRFGRSLALSGDDLVIRAGPDNAIGGHFLYRRNGSAWSQRWVFGVPNGHPGNNACLTRQSDVSIAGNVLVIGQPGWHGDSTAWIGVRSGSSWGPQVSIGNVWDAAGVGQAVLVHGGVAFVGVTDELGAPGFVSMWRLTPSGWENEGHLLPSFSQPAFGASLAISGTTLLAGGESAAEVLVQGGTVLDWTFQAALVPPGGGVLRAAVIDGDVAVISTSSVCAGPYGVHVFERTGTSWSLAASLTASDAAPPELGKSLLVRGDTIYAGAPSVDGGDGAVYVFQRQGSGWAQTAKLVSDPPLPPGWNFGETLAGDGEILCVGAPRTSGSGEGRVQIFDVVELPPPSGYCTAKVNSQGCLPAMGSSGVPSVSNPNPFLLTATNVLNNKTGLLLYTVNGPANAPFQGGIRCFATPFRRTPGQNSGGNPPPNDCSGTYSFDFNARIRSGIDPSLAPGVQVWAQYYSRDPGDPFLVGLTDAVTFTIGS